jgi:carboxypeptidase Taq
MSHEEAYKELLDRVKEVNLIGSIGAVLHWDEQTYMPRPAGAYRAEQVAFISGTAHRKFVDPKIGELLDGLENSPYMDEETSDEAVNIRELRHDYDQQTKLPQKLVEAISRETTLAQGVWAKARAESDFAQFKPNLEKILKLIREKADHLGYEKEAYDALLDIYEPGATAEMIGSVFGGLRDELVPLVKGIADSPKKPIVEILEREYPIGKQQLFGEMAARAIGYDFDIGRLDITTHPFTIGLGPRDTRITTRYNRHHFGQALFGTLHESGHGIYDQNLPEEHFGTPRAESVSLGIHESQSRMWENMVGRSKPFWKYFFPIAQNMFRDALADVAFDDFFFAINDVRPSFIRVEADEVTYNLHIMVRFEMERAIIKGDIKLDDIPAAWNEKFTNYLGITPENDANGCLQDVHWSAGLMGYFPTYALGNLYAAQFVAKAKDDIKYLETQFEAGNFSELLAWLKKNIHEQGKRYRADKLCEVVTGKPLDPKYAVDYLKTKFGELYGL